MIVTTMTAEEIYREIMRDLESVKRKGNAAGRIFQQEMLRKKIPYEMRTVSYKTAQWNEWQIIIRIYPDNIYTSFYLKGWDDVGMVAYTILFIRDGEDKFVIKYNSHFFKRYNERMNLGLTEPAKTLRHFFKNNYESEIAETQLLDDGTRALNFILKYGMGIGWQDDAKKMIQIKTFIGKETFTKKQQSLVEHIKNGLTFYQILKPEHMKNKI